MFEVGDKVVYPHHGAGTVVKKEKREVLGEQREYLTIQILHNDMTVNVPCENADRVGLRQVIDERHGDDGRARTLTGGSTEMPKNWNRRFKHNRDKMKTGNIFELAEVVRNLALREHEKGLSTGEKQMFVKAKKILASELMYAKDMDEDEAAAWLEDVLSRAGQPKPSRGEEGGAARPTCTRRSDRLSVAGVTASRCRRASGRSSSPPGAGERLGDRPAEGVRAARRPAAPRESLDASTRARGSTRSSSPRRRAGRSRRSSSPRSSAP